MHMLKNCPNKSEKLFSRYVKKIIDVYFLYKDFDYDSEKSRIYEM